MHVITASGTQGRFGNGQGAEFAEAYLLEYWRPALGKWVRYKNPSGEEVSFFYYYFLFSRYYIDPIIVSYISIYIAMGEKTSEYTISSQRDVG